MIVGDCSPLKSLKQNMTDSLTDWVTRSPIELSWTAKKGYCHTSDCYIWYATLLFTLVKRSTGQKERKFATKIALRQRWITWCFGWYTWCLWHLDGVVSKEIRSAEILPIFSQASLLGGVFPLVCRHLDHHCLITHHLDRRGTPSASSLGRRVAA